MQQRHVVIAEDEGDIAWVIAKSVERLFPGTRVTLTSDGEAALEAIQKRGADLLITDRAMPVMDGFTLLRILRARQITTPAIVVLADPTYVQDALEAGATYSLAKPFDLSDLRRVLTEALGGDHSAP